MGRMAGRVLSLVCLACLLTGAPATGARTGGPPPLWGGLEPGPYGAGYRTLFVHDPARPPLDGLAAPGRQMQINVWYPARVGARARMRFGDYVALLARGLDFSPPTPERRRLAAERFVEQPAELGGDAAALRARLPELLALETAAVENAPAAAGRFPLVVFPEYRTPVTQSVMAELLATHGFVVASPSLKGTFESDFAAGLADLETIAADAAFTAGRLRAEPMVDGSRVALVGVGIAASGCLALATRDPSVDAIVSLDGGIPTGFEDRLLKRTPYFDVAAVRIPILAVNSPHPSIDLALLDQYRYSARYLVHFPAMSEFHFLNYGTLERFAPGIIGKAPGDTKAGFEWACRAVLAFLRAHVGGDAGGLAFFSRPEANGAPQGLLVVTSKAALPPPPTLAELKGVFRARGVAGVEAEFRRRRASDPQPFGQQLFAELASWLGRGHDADWSARRAVAALRVESYPDSARAHFTLAQALAQTGARDAAETHYREVLRLLPADPDPVLDPDLRRRIERAATEQLQNRTP
jgi:hypothetical protein